jgi:hypothetical protein
MSFRLNDLPYALRSILSEELKNLNNNYHLINWFYTQIVFLVLQKKNKKKQDHQ